MIATTQRGIALVMTLWILAFLSVLAASYTVTVRLGTAAVRNFKEDAGAYYRAVAALEEAVAYLSNDDFRDADYIDASGLFRTGPELDPLDRVREYLDGSAEVDIIDLDSLININRLTPELFQQILTDLGYQDEHVSEAVDSLMDWRDPDDNHRLNGVESDYYEDLSSPYTAKNGPLDSVEELGLIKGLEKALDGSPEDGTAPLRGYLTVRSAGPLNINTVSAETMRLLGLSSQDVDVITQARAVDAGGPLKAVSVALFPGRPDLMGLFQGTSSRFERIVASAANREGSNRHVIVADVVRTPRPGGGYRVEILYWNDDAG